jgi:hypothetical protein
MKTQLIFFLFFLLFLSNNKINAQDGKKEISFILVINDEILGTSANLTFTIKTETTTEIIKSNYSPGKLTMDKLDFDKLMSSSTKTIYLRYFGTVYLNSKSNYYDFEIEYQKPWLDSSFNILRLYDLSITKYKKLYDPLSKDKNYTFNLDFGGGQMIHIRKKIKR